MAKDRKKVINIHSKLNDKQPVSTALEYGEIAVNYASGNAFISTKNSDDDVVRFSEDTTLVDWMDKKQVFPYEGEVVNKRLNDNNSQLLIKLNQDVSNLSPNWKDVGSDHEFLVDMSSYAMNGANPSFSSVTTTNSATFNGDTNILGNTANVEVKDASLKTDKLKVSATASTVSGDTINITENTSVNVSSPSVGVDASDNITLASQDVTISGSTIGGDEPSSIDINFDNACVNSEEKTHIYGKESTVIGVSCDDTVNSKDTTVKGNDININGDKALNLTANDITLDGATSVSVSAPTTCISSTEKSTLFGEKRTNVGTSCDGMQTSDEVNVSGTTINIGGNNINITSPNTKIESSGTTIIQACGGLHLKSDELAFEGCTEDSTISINSNSLCFEGDDKVSVYGVNTTNLGISCDEASASTQTNVGGTNISLAASEGIGETANTISLSAKDGVSVCGTNTVDVTSKVFNVDAKENATIDAVSALTLNGENITIGDDLTSTLKANANEISTSASTASLKSSLTNIVCDSLTTSANTIGTSASTINTSASTITTNCNNASINSTGNISATAKSNISIAAASGLTANGKVAKLNAETIRVSGGSETIQMTDSVSVSANSISGSVAKDATLSTDMLDVSASDRIGLRAANDVNIVSFGESASFCGGSDTIIGNDNDDLYSTHTEIDADTVVSIQTNGGSKGQDIEQVTIKSPNGHIGIGTSFYDDGSGNIVYHDDVDDLPDNVAIYGVHADINVPSSSINLDEAGIAMIASHRLTAMANNEISLTSGKNNIDVSGDTITISGGENINASGYSVTAKAFYAPSDIRYKDNISLLDGDEAIDKAASVSLKSFNFKDEPSRKVYGVIAQEVEQSGLGELIHKNEDGKLAVDYTSFLLLRVANLEKLVSKMQSELDALRVKTSE